MITTVEALRIELEEVLHHLYDPSYRPSDALRQTLDYDLKGETWSVRARVLWAIEALKPSEQAPRGTRRQLAYAILHYRFILGLQQEEAANLLHISLRTLQRAQREAIHTLALEMWRTAGHAWDVGSDEEATSSDSETSSDWQAQIEAELASLRASAPNRVTVVSEVLHDVLELESVLTAGRGLQVEVRYVQERLTAAVHPSAMRQTIISTISRLTHRMDEGLITIYAGLESGQVKITIAATLSSPEDPEDLVHHILLASGGSVQAEVDGTRAFVYIYMPSTGEALVLTIDDNPDMLHYYRRCATGTPYRIVEATSGRDALEIIRRKPPDAIVLDVMLPDVDGWKLLMQLHKDPKTSSIPIIVCTVVREQELAHSLGAAGFLNKPFAPQEFVAALDRLLHPQLAAPEREPGNSPEAS